MCLENTRKHEWDTLEFENEEHIREEFKDSKEVEEAVNEITNEPVSQADQGRFQRLG